MHLHRNTPFPHSQPPPSNGPHENDTRTSSPRLPSCSPTITTQRRMQTCPRHHQTENRHITTTRVGHILLTTRTTHCTPSYRARVTIRTRFAHKPRIQHNSSTHELPCVTAPARAPIHRPQTLTPELPCSVDRQSINQRLIPRSSIALCVCLPRPFHAPPRRPKHRLRGHNEHPVHCVRVVGPLACSGLVPGVDRMFDSGGLVCGRM
jgi:hypothetical protein